MRELLFAVATVSAFGCSSCDVVQPDLFAATKAQGPWVTVGSNGAIATSTNRTSWTARKSGVTATLKGVASGGGRIVAVGEQGALVTSTDGVTWTKLTSPTTVTLEAVAFSGSVWVAVGWSATILTSTDGVTWTQVQSGSGTFTAVAWFDGKFVAVDRGGGVFSSTTGTSWTTVQAPNTLGFAGLCGLAASASGWLAVDYFGGTRTSSDGTSWTVHANAFASHASSAVECDVTWAAEAWVVVDEQGDLETSTDGVRWTSTKTPLKSITGVASDGKDVAAVGNTGAVLATTCGASGCSAPDWNAVSVPAPEGGTSGTGGSGGSGGSSGGTCGDSQHASKRCPDGTSRCCSVNQVCCHDSASGGAIGCQFTGFCG